MPRVLSVLIPTIGREQSLQRTICELAEHDMDVKVELTIIENGKQQTLKAESLVVPGIESVRVLHEPRPGKASALNRALAAGGLAPVIAVLDDDMSPAPGWCSAVMRSVESRPAFDVFSGRSHVLWPAGTPPPSWARSPLAQGLAFSVIDLGPGEDREMGVEVIGYPSGNHFWFRRSVLGAVPRFPDVWPPEMDFVMLARGAGHRGVFVPEVCCGHRVQPELFDPRAFCDRAARFGAALARIEGIALRGKARGRVRALASWARACWRAMLWAIVRLAAAALPSRRGVPLRAKAACIVGRQKGRIRRAMLELQATASGPP